MKMSMLKFSGDDHDDDDGNDAKTHTSVVLAMPMLPVMLRVMLLMMVQVANS